MAIINQYTRKIWDRLIKEGATKAGAAGLMGNLYAESGCNPVCLENLCIKRYKERKGITYTSDSYMKAVDNGAISQDEFIRPMGFSYAWGLAQWTTPSRKTGLYGLCKNRNVSIGNLDAQLDYLMMELSEAFSGVWKILTTTSDVRTASDTVLKRFEMPADTGSAVQSTRYKYAMEYYTEYATTGVTADTIIGIFRSWIGYSEANGKHKLIIDIYNNHKPLARGYKVQYSDAWCDTTVSAAFITAGNTSIIGGTECGVYDHVLLFRQAGIWLGRVKPIPGDIIVFDWQRDGVQDHIGIVERIEGSVVTTIEGNYKDAVGRRTIAYNDTQIAGYARPKYAAAPADPEPVQEPAPEPQSVVASQYAEKYDPKLAGKYTVTTDLYLRDGKNTKYKILVTMPKGAVVQNYGYYSNNLLVKWLYVVVTVKGVKYTGFCSSRYLKKQ